MTAKSTGGSIPSLHEKEAEGARLVPALRLMKRKMTEQLAEGPIRWIGKHGGKGTETSTASCSDMAADSRKEATVAVSVVILPFDIIAAKILPRLPVKLLGRLRCVCKQWRALTHDPHFAMEQLTSGGEADTEHESAARRMLINVFKASTGTPRVLSYIIRLNSSCSGNGSQDIVEDCSFPFKLRDGTSHFLSNSVNGLVCVLCRNPEESVGYPYLFNPTTNEALALPEICDTLEALPEIRDTPEVLPLPDIRRICQHLDYVLLGYDASSGLYKLVSTHTPLTFPLTTTFRVLTVGSGGWRCAGEIPCYARPQEGVFLNGSIYWPIVIDRPQPSSIAILAFNVGDEKFQFIPVPKECVPGCSWRGRIALQKLEGHLCLVRKPFCYNKPPWTLELVFLRIWKLEDYVDHRWKRIFDIDLTSIMERDLYAYDIKVIDVVCGELLMERKGSLFAYDLCRKTLRAITEHLPENLCLDVSTSSLVSPDNLPAVG